MQTITERPVSMINAQGHSVPIDRVRPIDLARDDLVKEIVEKAKATSATLASFKSDAFADIAAFVQLSAEQYDAKLGGNKGNVTLTSYDGRFKIIRAIQERVAFDEKLQAAKALIDECFDDWSQGSRSEIRALISRAFDVDGQGNVNTGRILALRQVEIQDERWQRAMKALSDAVFVVGSKSYIRIYERDEKGEYQPIPLDVAGA